MVRLFFPSTKNLKDFYEKGRFLLAWRLCLLFSFIFFFLTIVFTGSPLKESLAYLSCFSISIASLIYLKKTSNYKLIYYVLSIAGTLIVAFTLLTFDDVIHYGDMLWIILIILFCFFGLGKKVGLICLTANMITIITYSLFFVNKNFSNIEVLSFSERIALTIEVSIAVISISYIFYQFVNFHNYSYSNILEKNKTLEENNSTILKQNEEKTILVKEIHHRVKNNLQIIISLLRLQKSEIKNREAVQHFNEAINRIMVMSLIHSKLYKEEELAKVELNSYFNELSNEIVSLSNLNIPLNLEINSELDKIGLKTIVPLGLIMNELLSNSVKHAFKKSVKGEINIELKDLNDNKFELHYKDNGTWVKPMKDIKSFGLELLDVLSEQLEGSLTRKTKEEGTTYVFNLKNLDVDHE